MKRWILGGVVLGGLLLANAASACPVSVNDGRRPWPVRPVENVSFEVSELFERASRLETVASSREADARSAEQQASTLANRARVLRSQIRGVDPADRASITQLADELAARASIERNRAARDRASATQLRAEAKLLRDRAIALSGGSGGGGWRGRTASLRP